MRTVLSVQVNQEGRTITVEYPQLYLVGTYVPNSGDKLQRLKFRTVSRVANRNLLYTHPKQNQAEIDEDGLLARPPPRPAPRARVRALPLTLSRARVTSDWQDVGAKRLQERLLEVLQERLLDRAAGRSIRWARRKIQFILTRSLKKNRDRLTYLRHTGRQPLVHEATLDVHFARFGGELRNRARAV